PSFSLGVSRYPKQGVAFEAERLAIITCSNCRPCQTCMLGWHTCPRAHTHTHTHTHTSSLCVRLEHHCGWNPLPSSRSLQAMGGRDAVRSRGVHQCCPLLPHI